MIARSKWLSGLSILMVLGFALSACQPTEVVKTVEVPVEVEVEVTREVEAEPETEEAAGGECCDVYRIALFEDPVSLNYWNYLGPGSSVWTAYIVSGQAASLYTLSDQRFDFVTSLAKDLPPDPVQEGDLWTITVEMVEDATWSDGESITANDVVFTQAACMDLKLTQNWPNQCWPSVQAKPPEALDDYTVKFYFSEKVGLGVWQAGVALAVILPEHFWADTVPKPTCLSRAWKNQRQTAELRSSATRIKQPAMPIRKPLRMPARHSMKPMQLVRPLPVAIPPINWS
jgi:ABC-type transport system substrate-binding protein